MRKYIGRIYVDYFFFNVWAICITCVALASVIFKLIGFEELFGVDIYIILWVVLGLVFLNHVIVVMLRDKYENNTFFEITDEHFKLAYTIKQNIFSKKFNIYKISINTGSEKLQFYISRKDVEQLENLLLTILENNLNYRRYKDEEY